MLPLDEFDDIGAAEPAIGHVDILGEDVRLDELEFVIVLGGDGTILRAAELDPRHPGARSSASTSATSGSSPRASATSSTETVERVLVGRLRRRGALRARRSPCDVGNEVVYATWA